MIFGQVAFLLFFGRNTCIYNPCKYYAFNTEQELTEYLDTHKPKRNQVIYDVYYGKFITLKPHNVTGHFHE